MDTKGGEAGVTAQGGLHHLLCVSRLEMPTAVLPLRAH